MSKIITLRKTDQTAADPGRRRKPDAEALPHPVPRKRSANEIALSIGLKPIKGRSGPKLAY